MRKEKIYKLIDPITFEIKYIGVTVQKLQNRLNQHKHEALHFKKTHKRHWLKKLYDSGYIPIIELIEEVEESIWEEKEIYWINYYGLENLTNSKQGGSGVIFKDKQIINKCAIGHYKPVVMLDLKLKYIKEFESVKAAAKYLNCAISNVTECLSGRTLSCRGYHFVYKNKYVMHYYKDLSSAFMVDKYNYLILTTTENKTIEFKSIKDVAIYLKCSTCYITMLIKGTRCIEKSKFCKSVKSIKKVY